MNEPRWANDAIDDDVGDVYSKRLELPRQTLRQCSQRELSTT